MSKLVLESGFEFDYENLFGEGKVEKSEVDALSAEIESAAKAIETMRETGVIRGHLSKDGDPELVFFSKLPYLTEDGINTPKRIEALQAWGEDTKEFDAVVSLGIGGSFLGNKVLFDIMGGEFWNYKTKEERNGFPEFYFSGNNLDSTRTTDLINLLKAKAAAKPGYKIMLVVISKSGSTIETMSNYFVISKELKEAGIEVGVTAVTDLREDEKETLLHKIAVKENWPIFSVPDGVGGRFSIFSEVGLITAAAIGFDIDAFLKGARDMDAACKTSDVFENPALLNAVLKYIASENHGRNIEVLMPYSDNLKSTSEWYIQLLAESLGKKFDRNNDVANYGRTPIVAVGTTDMHAQTQQHQEGALDKVVQFIEIKKWEDDKVISNPYKEFDALEKFDGLNMSECLKAALDSNSEALASDGRYTSSYVIPELNAYYLGQTLYMLALSIAYEGELADVDAFDQPGVEAYKKILGPKLKIIKDAK